MVEREWKLGVDLFPDDNLLDQITFDDLILDLHCNCRRIEAVDVRSELVQILDNRLEDMYELLERNIDEIIRRAKIGRGGFEKEEKQ